MKTARFLMISLIALSGCAQQYVVTLTNGTKVTTASKPKLQGGYYHFKNAVGGDAAVPEGRVREIAAGSIAREEERQNRFKPARPKRKHWYWPF